MLKKLLDEMKQVGLVTLYFLICFALLLTLKKLFLAQYEIEFYGVSAAVVGALVIGKVVVLLDHSRIGNRFDRGPLWVGVLYKTVIYTLITYGVLVAEKAIHEVREDGKLRSSLKHLWEHRDRDVMLATTVCLALAYAGYNLYSAIDRRLGEGTLRRMLFGKP
jgi:hypothetical protein